MGELRFQSKYAKGSYKPMMIKPNEEAVQNVLNREFDADKAMYEYDPVGITFAS